MTNPRYLLGMTLSDLKQVALDAGLPAFAAKQMAEWIYVHKVRSIGEMTNLSRAGRERLASFCEVGCMEPLTCQRSADGTVKYLFPTHGGGQVESVYIPDGERATLCVSSQVGCRMGCRFCMTGRQGFEGNLTATDILNQLYSLPERATLTNVVFMGQGEPLDNLDAVLRATELLTAPYGYAWSPRRITVSTVGVGAALERFLHESDCHLAVSLHNPFPDERHAMMPAEGGCSLEEFMPIIKKHDWRGQRRVSFEYIVFAGLNDTPRHAKALLRLLAGLECRVNLIRFHTIPDTDFRGAPEATMIWLRDYLTQHGLTTTIRASRGQDIFAACGLLSTKNKSNKDEEDSVI